MRGVIVPRFVLELSLRYQIRSWKPLVRRGDKPRPFAVICRFKPESDHSFTRFTQKDISKPLLSELKAWHRGLSRGVGLAPRSRPERKAHERTGRARTRRPPPGGLVPHHRGRQFGDAARHAGP